MANENPRGISRFVKFMIGKDHLPKVEHADLDISSGRERDNTNGEALTSVIEVVLTPVIFFGIGFLVDRHFHTVPVFSLVGVLFGAVGSTLKLYYSVIVQRDKPIGNVGRGSASIDIRSGAEPLTLDDSSRSLLSGNLEVSEELRSMASRLDAQSALPDEPDDCDGII